MYDVELVLLYVVGIVLKFNKLLILLGLLFGFWKNNGILVVNIVFERILKLIIFFWLDKFGLGKFLLLLFEIFLVLFVVLGFFRGFWIFGNFLWYLYFGMRSR